MKSQRSLGVAHAASRVKATTTVGLACVLFLLLTGQPAFAALSLPGWEVEDVSTSYGRLRIAAPGSGGSVAVAYARFSDIRYYSRAGGSWQGDTVTSLGASGRIGFAFQPGTGEPYVAYVSATSAYLTHYAGGTWQTETVFTGDVENGVALAFDPNGQPALAIAGNDGFTGALTYLYKDGGAWQSQTVATDHGGLVHPSLAFDPSDGQPAISYTGALGDLTFAKFNGSAWSTTIIDSSVSFGGQSELKYRPLSQDPVIAYEDAPTLRLAEFTGGNWDTLDIETGESGDTSIGVFYQFGMDVMANDSVYISWARGLSPDAMRISLYDDGELHTWVALEEYRVAGSALLVQGDELGVAFGNSWTTKLRYAFGPAPVPEPGTLAVLVTGMASLLFMAWGRWRRVSVV